MMSTRRISFVAIGTVVLFAAVELVLRLGLGLGAPALVYADPDFGYAFKPNQELRRFGHRISYNEVGLRSESLRSRPTLHRIVCLGDSVTNGGAPTDQAETYPYLLESYLRAHGNGSVQVLNASAGGWQPENEYEFIRKKGLWGAATLVLELSTHDLYAKKGALDATSDSNFPDHDPPSALTELWVRYIWPPLVRRFTRQGIAAQQADPTEEDLRRSLKAIERILMLGESQKAHAVILLTCEREELRQPLLFDHYRSALRQLAAFRKVVVLDIMPVWQKMMQAGQDPMRDNVHPNPAGNGSMARLVGEALLQADH
jgi:hypothetical protein